MAPASPTVTTELRPYAMVAGGDAIAKHEDGRVVFVPGALPEELVRVEVTATTRDYLRARVVEVLEPAPGRTEPTCPEFGRGCGGCQWQHITLPAQRVLKRQIVQDALRRMAHIEQPAVEPLVELPASGYRTTVRAGVVGGRAGYRRRAQHEVLPVGQCDVAHPLIEDLLLHGEYGRADEVVLRCGARTGERLAEPHPLRTTITVPEDARRDHVHEVVAGRTWRISASSFFQSRPDGAEALVDLVVAAAADLDPSTAVDLFSGVGLFAATLADRGWKVTAVESSRHAVGDARVNLRGAGVNIVRADVMHWRPVACDLVVVNPSRRGLGKEGVAAVVATGAGRVVLVSCDVAAFARDTGLLRSAGFDVTSIKAVDMFPHTFHVEVVTTFSRGTSR